MQLSQQQLSQTTLSEHGNNEDAYSQPQGSENDVEPVTNKENASQRGVYIS